MENFIELTENISEGKKLLINKNNIAYIKPHDRYVSIYFNAIGNDRRLSVSVQESIEQIRALL